MTQQELDELPEVSDLALYMKDDDGEFTCSITGITYMVGWVKGVRVKRVSTNVPLPKWR